MDNSTNIKTFDCIDIEEKLYQCIKSIKWHKKHLKNLKFNKTLYKAILVSYESGAVILLDNSEILSSLVDKHILNLISHGNIEARATADFVNNERTSEWTFDLTHSSTKYTIDNKEYTYQTLEYPLYIPDLSLDDIDEMCDMSRISGRETKFNLTCALYKLNINTDIIKTFVESLSDDKKVYMNSLTDIFDKTHHHLNSVFKNS